LTIATPTVAIGNSRKSDTWLLAREVVRRCQNPLAEKIQRRYNLSYLEANRIASSLPELTNSDRNRLEKLLSTSVSFDRRKELFFQTQALLAIWKQSRPMPIVILPYLDAEV
jgi:type II secretory pathway predicted ATPase ExeA